MDFIRESGLTLPPEFLIRKLLCIFYSDDVDVFWKCNNNTILPLFHFVNFKRRL